MDKIQEKITEKKERNRLSRVVHAKSDKDAVGAWKLDLNRTLHFFNVRSITSVWSSLTDRFQTELAVNTNVVVSDVRRDVVTTRTIVSEIHQAVVKGRGEADNKSLLVSVTRTMFITRSTLTIH